MSFYPVVPPAVTSGPVEDAAAGLLGLGGMVAVRLADLVSPAGAGLGKAGRWQAVPPRLLDLALAPARS